MIKMMHSGWAYVVLILVIVAVISAIMGMNSNKEFSKKSKSIALFALIASHIQLLAGLAAYFVAPGYLYFKEHGMGATMKDSSARDQFMEHPLLMIIAIILITIGFSKHKSKPNSKGKFKTIAIFYGIALLLMLVKIPWAAWLNH